MIDGIKTYNLKASPEQLETNPYLLEHWTTTIHNTDGVVKYGLTEYLGLKFQLKHGKIRLQGSLHKYHNAGLHNYDDFTAMNVVEVVNELSQRFEIDTTKTELNNIEFGVNVVLPFKVSLVLDNLIVYKGEPFIKVVEDGMNYYQCKRTKFIIKVYDKSLQYKRPENILRFEIKVIVMEYLKTKGVPIGYLSDLLNTSVYEPLGNILTEVFESILFGDDTINENELNTKERELYLRGSNPKTWKPQKGEAERKRLQRLASSFKSLLDQHRRGVDFRRVVSELIRTKSLELSHIPQIIRHDSNVLELANIYPSSNSQKVNNTGIVPNGDIYYTLFLGHLPQSFTQHKVENKIKLCSGCGKPIESYRKYHSIECKTRRDERNSRSNKRNNFKRKIRKLTSKASLFDVLDLVKLTSEQKEWLGAKKV